MPDLVLFLFIPIVWGLNFVVIKAALPAFASPEAFNALRWALAATTLLVLVGIRRDPLGIAPRDWGRVLFVAAVGNVLQQVTFINGIQRTAAGHAALIMGLSPVLVALANAAWRLEPVSRRTWLGIAFSVGGLVLLLHPGTGRLPRAAFWGDLLTLASAACWAVYTVASRPLATHYPPVAVTATTVTVAALGLVILGLPALRAERWGDVPWTAWGALLYSGGLTLAFGYAIWSVAIRRIGTARTAVLANLNPVVAVGAAWLLLGERLDVWQALGAALVVASIALTRR
jgi:drug/metabolite transporter (DMT)-like permease